MGRRDEALTVLKRIKRKTRNDIQGFVDVMGDILNDEWYWLRERIDVEDVMFYKKNKHLRRVDNLYSKDDMEIIEVAVQGTRIVKGGEWFELLKGVRISHELSLNGYSTDL
jgi:hypothetical protein